MHILLLHQHFCKPEEGGGIRSYHIAKALSNSGHTVTIITAHAQKFYKEQFEGMHIFYLPVTYKNYYGFIRRIYAFFKFYIKAKQLASTWQHIELIYAISTPLSVGWLGKMLSQNLNSKFIFEVGDLWPAVPVSLGLIQNRWLINWLYRMEKRIYDAADHIIALSPGMFQYMSQKSNADKILIIPNMADLNIFKPPSVSRNVQDELFTIGYFGTFGYANDIPGILTIARKCQDENLPVRFILMGDGAYRKSIKDQIKGDQLNNVQLMGHGSTQKVADNIQRCDAVLVSFLNDPMLHTGSPNKFFDGLAAGRMIIHNLSGWVDLLVKQHHIGFHFETNKPETFTKQLKQYLNDKSKLYNAQDNALKLAQNSYEKNTLCLQIVRLVESTRV